MADEVFRPRKINDGEEQLGQVEAMRQALGADDRASKPDDGSGIKVEGNVPKEFLQALKAAQNADPNQPLPNVSGEKAVKPFSSLKDRGPKKFSNEERQGPVVVRGDQHSSHLKELLEGLRASTAHYEEILLPSKGKFYDGTNGPANGIVNIRQMTGEEEQILATPRFVRKGQAINMIFKRCLLEQQFQPENLLTADRTYLLIYLRGISYSNHYDVEVKCPECEKKFSADIDLSTLFVEHCPDEFGPLLDGVLPTTNLPFRYRLSTGRDEQEITEYRDRRIKAYGDSAADDTLTHRTSMLLEDIDGISEKNELQILLKNLPINDVAHIRNCINEPPFGVDTNVEIFCPSCLQEFEMDLPLEANFFFPRKKKGENTPA